jgi:hypothetical protein
MPNKEIVTRNLDLWARGIDLLTSLSETANSPHSVVRVGMEIGRWLGREKLNERELRFCLEKARGLVIPNSHGQQFYDAVLSGTQERSVGPLFVQPSGALGRLMANDPFLCWMTSTIACLFEFHSENFISDVLCSFIMQANIPKDDGKPMTEYQLAWHPVRLQLKPVLDKIVSSIWFNIVNSGVVKSGQSGSDVSLPLPLELKEVCPRGHNIESHTLGLVLNQLRTPRPQVIVDSDHVITNLALWLIYHFNGRLRVTVSSKIVFDKVLGPEKSLIELRAHKFCSPSGPCDSAASVPTFKIYSMVTGRLDEFLSGKYDTQMTLEQSPRVRQRLYQPQVRAPSGSAGRDSIKVLVRKTAHEIVKWLLNLPVSREASNNELCFGVHPDQEAGDSPEDFRLADLLARVPSILNMGWEYPAAKVVYSKPMHDETTLTVDNFLDVDSTGENSILEDLENEDFTEPTPETILPYFPILRDIMSEARKSCRCTFCRKPEPPPRPVLVVGCLRHTTFMEVMTHVAHSIADAFGAEDASGGLATTPSDLGVINILYDVIGGSVRWRSWLTTASRVVLGCPPIGELTGHEDEGDYGAKSDFADARDLSSTVIAVQYGNLVVIAPWLDISKPLNVKRCFGFKVVTGRVGILNDEGSPQAQLQSLEGETAVIETQHTEDTQNFADKYVKQAEEVGSRVEILPETSIPISDYILASAGPGRYKLLMRVTSENHSRLIDPTRAMIKTSQPVLSFSCRHTETRNIIEAIPPNPLLKIYTFDELLSRWPDALKGTPGDSFNTPRRRGQEDEEFAAGEYYRLVDKAPDRSSRSAPTFRVSHILDSHLTYNVALALTFDDVTIVNHETACLACIIEKGKSVNDENGIENADRNRWVIQRTAALKQGRPIEQHLEWESRKRIKA